MSERMMSIGIGVLLAVAFAGVLAFLASIGGCATACRPAAQVMGAGGDLVLECYKKRMPDNQDVVDACLVLPHGGGPAVDRIVFPAHCR